MRLSARYGSLILVLLAVLLSGVVHAQIGGRESFQFLNVPVNARLAALGGSNISYNGGDVNWTNYNPATLDSVVAHAVAISYVNFFGETRYSQLAYVLPVKPLGKVGLGLTHLGHGSFESYDEAGNYLGTFDTSEYAIRISAAHRVGPFVMGIAPQLAVSSIAGYRSAALMFDVGGLYQHPARQLTVGMAVKNAGFAISRYADAKSRLPFDVQLGVTFKPEQMPVIFSFTGTNLPRQNMSYYEPASRVNFSGSEPDVFDKVFGRINIGTEFLLGSNFHLLAGYNHRIRNELRLEQSPGASGFSFGFWLRIKAFELSIAKSFYHVVGGNTHFTISHNVNQLFHSRKKSI